MQPILFLFPSYQPTVLFCELLERFRQIDPSPIVVVDDGSGPAYDELFRRAARVSDTVVLKNAVNLGKGAALKHGINHILVNYPDCIGVVTADADGQHAVEDILKVANELRSLPGEAIFGSRSFKRDVPFRSKIGNIISRYVYRFLIGLNLSDTQTGLRGIPRRLGELSLGIRANRYEFETEQLIILTNERIGFREIPIQTIYIDDNRESHFRPLYDSLKIYFVLLRYALASVAAAATDLVTFWIIFGSTQQILLSNMSARMISLWVQLALLQSFVFRRKISVRIFVEYIGLVLVSGLLSSALQIQLLQLVNVPLLTKIVADTLVFLFNFLFIRDFIFRRWNEAATED
ncbi:MAG: glycosyltransferase [Bradyrhizobium sp.]|uniref:glycosyltransferase n=1 Tax=Bradyrhizobium sp. TaxID=376 RepID=UPI00271CBB14|nr:glycosyltransferase [Bradyrhizobium sp.]MDO8399636.1 glycosyltransferase [Bradyrhizobium sp.]